MDTYHIGRVGNVKPPREVGDDTFLNFSLAVSRGWGENEKTMWLQASLRNKDAVYPYIQKGAQIGFNGYFQVDEFGNPPTYTTDDGEVRSTFRYRVTRVKLLSPPTFPAKVAEPPEDTPKTQSRDLDEIPF